MKKHLLTTWLLSIMMMLGVGSAWAGDKTVVKYSFDDANSPAVTAGSRVSLDYTRTSVITSTAFLNAWNNANGDPGASTISLGSTDLSAETWTLSFEWAAVGGCNSKADHTTLKAGDTNLFDLSGNSNWNTTVTLSVGGAATQTTLPVPGCDKGKRFTANTGDQMNTTTYWHHIVVTGSSDGVKLTITNSNSGDAIVTDLVLSETNVNPTSLIVEPCCGGAIGIDELSLSYYVEGEVIQTPTAAYTSVDGINRTITATCATEGATLYYSTDGENWTEGASVTISESGNVYFKAVKGNSESDVLTFAAEAGTEIVLNAPTIARNANGTVTISADQSKLLLAPTATIYYTYGEENGSFTGSKELTVAADATITAYAEAEGYAKSADATRAVALFPEYVNSIFSAAAATKGWSANTFSEETITASERTYATLLLDEAAWSENVLLQTDGAWGLRASGNWYINSNTANSWLLVKDAKAGNIVVVDATFAPAEAVNATYAEKYSFGTKHAYTIDADGNAELALVKPSAQDMDYLYGVYGYSLMSDAEKALVVAKEALKSVIDAAKTIDTTDKKGAEDLANAISDAETALAAEGATVESLGAAKTALEEAVSTFIAIQPIIVETDLTAQFPVDYQGWVGATAFVGWAAPEVTTNDGRKTPACERYNGDCNLIGDVFTRTLTGLTNGTYRIELYGAAANTPGRGCDSGVEEGDMTSVYLYTVAAGDTVKQYIPAHVVDNFNGTGISTAVLDNVVITDGTVKLGMYKEKAMTNWHVIQIKGVTAMVDLVELHANELAAAKAALNAEENAVVTGEEKTNLETAIEANATVAEHTADAYQAAIKALSDATAAFTGAKEAYEGYVAAQASVIDLPYAKAEKKPVAEAATSAADATRKAEALLLALRAYYESNALAEGVEGAKIATDSIKNAKAEDGINNWAIVLGEGSEGNIDVKSNEPWTDAAGVAEHKYFDGGNWGANAWDVALEQKIALPAGKYLLTTIARASGDVDFTLYAGTDSVKIAAIGAAGGVFNRGWNNASVEFEVAEADSIVIGVRGVTSVVHNWMSFSDFRLVQLAAPQPEFDENIVYSWESPEGTPIEYGGTIAYVNGDGNRLNYLNSGYYTICLNGKKANLNDETASANAGHMVITLDKAVAAGDTIAITGYITKNTSSKSSAWIVYENGTTTESAVFGDESNIFVPDGGEATGAINTKYVIVSAEAAGSKTITLTRGQTGTNLFITKLQVINEKQAEAEPDSVKFDFADANFREKIGTAMADVDGFIYNETFTADGATLQITAGSAPSRIYVDANRGQNLVTYKEYTTLTFNAPEGKAITKIEFTAAGNSNINNFVASSGAIEGMTWTGNAEGVRFAQGGTSYLAKAVLTVVDKTAESAALPAIEYTKCANIAEFNALEAGSYAEVTLTDAEVIGKSADGYSTVWVQDATGGCWIQYTSLNAKLNEKTKINGTVFVVKRANSGNPQMKEAEATLNSQVESAAIEAYTMVEGTIDEVNVAANLNKVVKITADSLVMTNATAGTLYVGTTSIAVNNGNATANQLLCKIEGWEKGKKLENIVIEAILSAKSASENQLLPIAITEAPAPQPVIADGVYDLTSDMFMKWESHEATEGQALGCNVVLNEPTGLPYGDGNVFWLNYANLSGYDKLVVTVEEGAPRFCFNRTEDNAQDNDDPETAKFIDIPGHSWGTQAYETVDESNHRFIIDLKKMTEERGFAHLHAIKGANWANVKVSAMKLVKGDVNLPTSGISTVKFNLNQNGTIYNLNGQKMEKAQKGLYIINGRKVVIK